MKTALNIGMDLLADERLVSGAVNDALGFIENAPGDVSYFTPLYSYFSFRATV
jgi:hypothetical protein